MKVESCYFTVFPSVVKARCKSEITITPIHSRYVFTDKKYTVTVIPKEKREYPRRPEYQELCDVFTEVCVEVKDGAITLSHTFLDEQEYRLVLKAQDGNKLYDFSIYALNEDLYGTTPQRGDLHIHTNRSDGLESIEKMVAACREIGLDFIAVTDHHRYAPSIEAIKMFEGVETGLTIFPGEEVHNVCDGADGYFHVINFGGSYSVSNLIASDCKGLCTRLRKEAESISVPDGVDAFEYLFFKWIADEIRKSGGLAILPHPYWTVGGTVYHLDPALTAYLLKSGVFDAFEVQGGCDEIGNMLQQSLYYELRAEGVELPIVGSTDAHNCFIGKNRHFGSYSTLALVRAGESVADAIMDKRSVALKTIQDEHPVAIGSLRHVKYALFLMDNFYPTYIKLTKPLGDLIFSYAKLGKCKDEIKRVNAQAQEYKRNFLGL